MSLLSPNKQAAVLGAAMMGATACGPTLPEDARYPNEEEQAWIDQGIGDIAWVHAGVMRFLADSDPLFDLRGNSLSGSNDVLLEQLADRPHVLLEFDREGRIYVVSATSEEYERISQRVNQEAGGYAIGTPDRCFHQANLNDGMVIVDWSFPPVPPEEIAQIVEVEGVLPYALNIDGNYGWLQPYLSATLVHESLHLYFGGHGDLSEGAVAARDVPYAIGFIYGIFFQQRYFAREVGMMLGFERRQFEVMQETGEIDPWNEEVISESIQARLDALQARVDEHFVPTAEGTLERIATYGVTGGELSAAFAEINWEPIVTIALLEGERRYDEFRREQEEAARELQQEQEMKEARVREHEGDPRSSRR